MGTHKDLETTCSKLEDALNTIEEEIDKSEKDKSRGVRYSRSTYW